MWRESQPCGGRLDRDSKERGYSKGPSGKTLSSLVDTASTHLPKDTRAADSGQGLSLPRSGDASRDRRVVDRSVTRRQF
jgi:hypothetical protein